MKNHSLILLTFLALALFSCRKEESKLNNGLLTITASQQSYPDLKTNIRGVGELGVTWKETDHLAIFDATTDNKNVKFSYSEGAGTHLGTFTGSISSWSTGQKKTFSAVYPYDELNTSEASPYTFTIPVTQTQDFTNPYAHLGLNDFMAASPVEVTKTSGAQPAINFSFDHLMAILDIEVTNSTGAPVTVTQISILREAGNFTQTANLNLTLAPGSNYEATGFTNKLDLIVQGASSTGVNGIFTGSMIIAPADLSSGITGFVVTVTSGTQYAVTKTAGPSLAAGNRYKAQITITTPSFFDIQGSKAYKTVTIGTQTWMAENLAYLPFVFPSSDGSESLLRYYVYNYEGTSVIAAKGTDNYGTYGVLYNWPSAMNGAASSTSVPSGVQGICPSGWHLPSDAEWKILEMNQGMSPSDADAIDWRSTGAVGEKLKEAGTTHWTSPNEFYPANPAAFNSSGFTALPGGVCYSGGFIGLGDITNFWSASENGASPAWIRHLYYNHGGVTRSGNNTLDGGFSVRCLKDI